MGNFCCCCRCCCRKYTEHVRFNVGGKKFDTTWGTVTRRGKDMDNLLVLLTTHFHGFLCFCKPKGVKRLKMRGYPNSGTFIDRDPTQFQHILNWLREDGDGVLPLLEERSFRALLKEAEYYRLPDMVKTIYETLNPTVEYVQ